MASSSVYTSDELVGERNADLRSILREAGKPSYGNKAALIQRILNHRLKKSDTIKSSIEQKLESIHEMEKNLSILKSELVALESSATANKSKHVADTECNPLTYTFQAAAPNISIPAIIHNLDDSDSDHDSYSTPVRSYRKEEFVPTPAPRLSETAAFSSVKLAHITRNESFRDHLDNQASRLASHQSTRPKPLPRLSCNTPSMNSQQAELYYNHHSQPCVNSTPEPPYNRPIVSDTVVQCRDNGTLVAKPPLASAHAHLASHSGSSCNCSLQTALLEKISESISDAHYPIVEPNIFLW